MIGWNFPDLSSRLAPRFRRFSVVFLHTCFFHISFIFFHIFLIFLSYFLYIPSYFLHIYSESKLERRGRGRKDFEGPHNFHIYSRGRARNFSKSHRGLWLIGISQTYLNNSHLASVDSGSYVFTFTSYFFIFLRIFFIFLHISFIVLHIYFIVLHISSAFGPERRRRGGKSLWQKVLLWKRGAASSLSAASRRVPSQISYLPQW